MKQITRSEFNKLVAIDYAGTGYVDSEGYYRTDGPPHIMTYDSTTGATILEPVEIIDDD